MLRGVSLWVETEGDEPEMEVKPQEQAKLEVPVEDRSGARRARAMQIYDELGAKRYGQLFGAMQAVHCRRDGKRYCQGRAFMDEVMGEGPCHKDGPLLTFAFAVYVSLLPFAAMANVRT